MCVCDLKFNWIQTLGFLHPVIHLPKKQKKKIQIDTWRKIRPQLNSNLESNQLWTLQFLHSIIHLGQKLKIRWDTWHIIEISIKI